MIITTLLIFATIAYIIEFTLLRAGLNKADCAKKNLHYTPNVSIIVAARNEEEHIEQCLTSLSLLDYPKEKLQIIVVNDRSTDRTQELVIPFIRQYPFMKLITTSPEKDNLRGKANAVAQGIDNSNGEIMMLTDADCTVPRNWVRETVQYFDENAGIVGGFTLLDANKTFEGMQTLDWIFLFGLASSAVGWKIPLTVIGNNFSVRRSAYDAVGGYSSIPFSVTEDYALVQAIIRRTAFDVRFPVNPQAVVKSRACLNWGQLFRQKQRWSVGGLEMVFSGMLITSVVWLTNLMLVAGLFFVPLPLWLAAFSGKSIMDVLFLWKPLKCFNARRSLRYFPAFECYMVLYVLIVPVVALFSKNIVWKERTL